MNSGLKVIDAQADADKGFGYTAGFGLTRRDGER
mgnify:FL=1